MRFTPRLGRVETQIMQVLWERRQATAREITDALNVGRPVAHSTVQTMLRGLEAKGAVGHEAQGRTFVFRPLVPQTDARRQATRDLVARLFGDSAVGLVAYLLQHEKLSADDLARVRRIIDEEEP